MKIIKVKKIRDASQVDRYKSMSSNRFRELHSKGMVAPNNTKEAKSIIKQCLPFAPKEGLYGRTIQLAKEYLSDNT